MRTAQKIILVEGTWGGDWARPGSDLRAEILEPAGFDPFLFQGWSEEVDGVPNILEGRPHASWIAGGFSLGYLFDSVPFDDRIVIAHSHGVNSVLYQAVKYGQPIKLLLSVCSPVRDDMRLIADAAKTKIGSWLHVSAKGFDLWQTAGELFGGGSIGQRIYPEADENIQIPGIGHSKLLNDPAKFPLWHDDGLIDFLRTSHVQRPTARLAGA